MVVPVITKPWKVIKLIRNELSTIWKVNLFMSTTKIPSAPTLVLNLVYLREAWREISKKSTAFIFFGAGQMIPTVTLDSRELEKVHFLIQCPYLM